MPKYRLYVFLFLICNVTAQYVKVFTCSNIVLSITILLLIGSVALKSMILVFLCEISIPNVCTILCKACNPLCKLSSESAMTTWSSANNMVQEKAGHCFNCFSFMFCKF
jgi:hypothetical protein